MILSRTLILIDACNVLGGKNGNKKSIRAKLEKIKKVLIRKQWLFRDGNLTQIVVDSGHLAFSVEREHCFDSVELVWAFKDKKTKISYTADDYIVDVVWEQADSKKFKAIYVVSDDYRLIGRIITGTRIDSDFILQFVSVKNFWQGKF